MNDHPPSEWLSALADGELSSDELQVVRAHLAGCADCTVEAAAFAQLRGAIALTPTPAEGWEERQLASARGHLLAQLRRRAAATAAAVAALVAAALISFMPHDPGASPQVGRMLVSHATSAGGGDPSRLAPAAVQTSFGATP